MDIDQLIAGGVSVDVLQEEFQKPWFVREIPAHIEQRLASAIKIPKDWEYRAQLERAYLKRSKWVDYKFGDKIIVRLCEPANNRIDIYVFNYQDEKIGTAARFRYDQETSSIYSIQVEYRNEVGMPKFEIQKRGRNIFWSNSPDAEKQLGDVGHLVKLFQYGEALFNHLWIDQVVNKSEQQPTEIVDQERDVWFMEKVMTTTAVEFAQQFKINFWNYLETIYMEMGGY